jgi:signal transduction histidine kinase
MTEPAPSGADAETRTLRTITMVAGAAAIAFFGISLGPIQAVSGLIDPIYAISAVAIVFGMPVALALAAPFLHLRAMRIVLGIYAIAFLVIVLLWLPALHGRHLPDGVSPWTVEVTALATVPAALAWRPVLGVSYLVVNSLVIAPVRYFTSDMTDVATPLQFAFFTLTFAAIFTVIAYVAVRSAAALDAATEQARSTASRAAAGAARRQEQARLDALVHDAVMGTLYSASQGDAALDPAVRRQAAVTLAQLQDLRQSSEDTRDVAPGQFAARIRSVVLEISPAVTFTAVGDRAHAVPSVVAAALAEATAEAMRNSVAHAGGPTVERQVSVDLDVDRIRVLIADTGRGFDPGAVPPHRLGILVSIRGRMEAIRHGLAEVAARPGGGTRVLLEWRDQ